MKFNRIHLQILDKIEIQKLAIHKASIPLFPDESSLEIKNFLNIENVVLSGEFPGRENIICENFLEKEANLQAEITPETELLVCGQYPDWGLVEEARLYGIRILFADKAGELFSRMATKLYKSNRPLLSYKEPLGV